MHKPLQAYSDADWADDQADRKFTSGYCAFIGANIISWTAKKQSTVARSSMEAEYRALATAAADITWLRRLLQDFNASQTTPTTLLCDNISAIVLVNNPIFHAQTKHIKVDYHYIRDCIQNKEIEVQYVHTQDQLASISQNLHQTQGQTSVFLHTLVWGGMLVYPAHEQLHH